MLTDQPPSDAVGEPAGLRLELGRSDTASVLIENVVTYPTGFAFELVATHLPHPDPTGQEDLLYGLCGGIGRKFVRSHRAAASDDARGRDEDLLLYLAFSPGGNVASELPTDALRSSSEAQSLTPRPLQAHASVSTIRATYWIQPIPSEGTLTFACEWRVFGITRSSCTVDASLLIAAAARSEPEAWLSEKQSGVALPRSKPFFVPLRHAPRRRTPGVSPKRFDPMSVQPAGTTGELVQISFTLARSDRAVIRIRHVVACPTGFQFEAVATYRPSSGGIWDPMHGLAGLRGRPGDQYGELSDEHLRLGIEFPGGGKATNVGPPLIEPASADTREPSLTYIEGGAATGLVHALFWVSPLPDPGPLVFYCEWPEYGVPLTRHRIEAATIREAASRAPTR